MAKPIDRATDHENDNESIEGEITLIDLFAALWRHKFLIIGMTFGFALFIVVCSVISIKLPPEKSYMPNKFTVNSDMLIKNEDSGGSSLSSVLGGASALAGLAGISLSGGATNSALALYLISSRELLDSLIDEFNLYERFNFELEEMQSPRSTARDMVKKMLSAGYDEDNGIFTVSCTSTDPQFAFDIVNFAVNYLEQKFLSLGVDQNLLTKKNLEENIDTCFQEIQRLQKQMGDVERSVSNVYGPSSVEPISMKFSMIEMELSAQQEIYKQLKVQYELLKIEMATETPIFQVLSRPEIPDRKSGPSRAMLCIIVTFVAGCLSVLLSFLLEAWNNLKNDESAMAKFKSNKRDKGRGSRLQKTKGMIKLVRANKKTADLSNPSDLSDSGEEGRLESENTREGSWDLHKAKRGTDEGRYGIGQGEASRSESKEVHTPEKSADELKGAGSIGEEQEKPAQKDSVRLNELLLQLPHSTDVKDTQNQKTVQTSVQTEQIPPAESENELKQTVQPAVQQPPEPLKQHEENTAHPVIVNTNVPQLVVTKPERSKDDKDELSKKHGKKGDKKRGKKDRD